MAEKQVSATMGKTLRITGAVLVGQGGVFAVRAGKKQNLQKRQSFRRLAHLSTNGRRRESAAAYY